MNATQQFSDDTTKFGQSSQRLGLILVLAFVSVLSSACSSEQGTETPTTVVDVLPSLRGLKPNIAQADAAFESVHYAGNVVCSACHTDQATGDAATMKVQGEDGEFRDLSLGRAWETSLMANATRDPYWHAAVAAELHNFPDLSVEINDTCTRCHAPMASDKAKKEGFTYQLFDSGSVENGDFVQGLYSMDKSNDLFNHAMDGVSCSFCHQIADDGNLGTDQGMSGQWSVLQYSEENVKDRPAFGQYTDPDQGYMRQQSGFTPVYGAHISTSETCATCHNLKTSPVTKKGEPVPGVDHFAEQMVYTEWENSVYDDAGSQPRTCQSCHMPKVDAPIPLAGAGGSGSRTDFAEHSFLGPNTVMQTMIKNYKDELGVSSHISEADFDEAIARNRAFLKTSAALELQNIAFKANDGSMDKLNMDVKVSNLTGHKLPSGYHSRRAYLHVLVTDADGMVVYENGRIRPDGSIDGVSEDTSPDSYEAHYDKITSATQVQVYQGITKDSTGEITHSLLAATGYLKDNRLTPLGFDKNTVSEDVAVHGAAKTDDDFNNGQDIVNYDIALKGKAPYTALVELRYQSLSFGALMSLFALSDEVDQVDMFRTIYDDTALRDEVITTVTTKVE